MITIATIDKNKCYFQVENHLQKILYSPHDLSTRRNLKNDFNEYIWDIISPYITFLEIDSQELITVACQQLTKIFPEKKPDNDFFYHTEASYSFPKKFLELIYCQPMWKDYELSKPENMNNIACLFSIKQHVIENTCIIIANRYDVNSPKSVVLDSVTKQDILRVIRRRYYFSAILVQENNLVKYYYQNPVYLISTIFGLNQQDSIQHTNLDFLKYNLLFYFQHDKSKYLNKIATRINGNFQLHGDVLILHSIEDGIFVNLSLREIKRINVLSYGRLYDRELQSHEIRTEKLLDVDEQGNQHEKIITPYWSRYIIIEERIKKWKNNKNKCLACGINKHGIVCCICFRAKFCSLKCQQDFDHYHYQECINPKSLS